MIFRSIVNICVTNIAINHHNLPMRWDFAFLGQSCYHVQFSRHSRREYDTKEKALVALSSLP